LRAGESAREDLVEGRVHAQAALESRGILADYIDVHLAVDKLRRRYGWRVSAEEGVPGCCLVAWPYLFRKGG